MLLPCKWPIVLRGEAKRNTQDLCCAVTTDSKDSRSGFKLLFIVSISEFLVRWCLGVMFFPLAALKILLPSSQLLVVKCNSETMILGIIQTPWLSGLSLLRTPQVPVTRLHASFFLELSSSTSSCKYPGQRLSPTQ